MGYRVKAQAEVRAAGVIYEGSCLASRISSSHSEIISKEGDIIVKNQKSPTFKRQDLRRKLSHSHSRNYKKMKEGVFSQKSNKKFFLSSWRKQSPVSKCCREVKIDESEEKQLNLVFRKSPGTSENGWHGGRRVLIKPLALLTLTSLGSHPGSLGSFWGHHYLQESPLNNLRTTFQIKIYIHNLNLKRSKCNDGKSTGFEFQVLGSIDVLVRPSTNSENWAKAVSLVLYFFFHGKNGVTEESVLNKVVLIWFSFYYSTVYMYKVFNR